jgi:hypothetical protein
MAALILQLRTVITGFLKAPAVLKRLGILPEIEDDDLDSEDGYDELKTPELEEDQITVVTVASRAIEVIELEMEWRLARYSCQQQGGLCGSDDSNVDALAVMSGRS